MKKDRSPQPEWLTIDECAAKLRVHHSTVRKWIKNGTLPAFVEGTGRRITYRIHVDDLHALRRERGPQPRRVLHYPTPTEPPKRGRPRKRAQ